MSDICQICLSQDSEDIALIYEMLSLVFKAYLEANLNLNSQVFTYVFKHINFRRSLGLVFDSKYMEINDQCVHQKLIQIYLSLWSNHIGQQEKIEHRLLDSGLTVLYISIVDKQEKLKESKEQFDQLAQQLFSYDNEQNDQQSEQFDSEDSDKQGHMQFNKNSNKNKFQKRSIDILKKWFIDHLENPYPDQSEKISLSQQTGMHVRQIQNWFTNSRKRYLEPLKKKFQAGTINIKKFQQSSSIVSQLEKDIKEEKEDNLLSPTRLKLLCKEEQMKESEDHDVVVIKKVKQEDSQQINLSNHIENFQIPLLQQFQSLQVPQQQQFQNLQVPIQQQFQNNPNIYTLNKNLNTNNHLTNLDHKNTQKNLASHNNHIQNLPNMINNQYMGNMGNMPSNQFMGNPPSNIPIMMNMPTIPTMSNIMPNIPNMSNNLNNMQYLASMPAMVNIGNPTNNLQNFPNSSNMSGIPNYAPNTATMNPLQQQIYYWQMNEWQKMQQTMQFQMMQQQMPYYFIPKNNGQKDKD